mmetsp:Transcript_10995/g.26610  ORF Transcript_10995/g.26610 Transcript_10995/m.26610 type:complete len:205 (+) Transcript_10995:1592-2206(+)
MPPLPTLLSSADLLSSPVATLLASMVSVAIDSNRDARLVLVCSSAILVSCLCWSALPPSHDELSGSFSLVVCMVSSVLKVIDMRFLLDFLLTPCVILAASPPAAARLGVSSGGARYLCAADGSETVSGLESLSAAACERPEACLVVSGLDVRRDICPVPSRDMNADIAMLSSSARFKNILSSPSLNRLDVAFLRSSGDVVTSFL